MFNASKRTARLGFLLLLGAVTLEPATRGDEEVKGLLKELQGEWTFENEGEGSWNFEKSKATVKLGNGATYVTSMSLDEKVEPIQVDFKIEEGPGDTAGLTVLGVLKREDKQVVLAVSHPGKDRPTTFEPVEDQVVVFKLTRK